MADFWAKKGLVQWNVPLFPTINIFQFNSRFKAEASMSALGNLILSKLLRKPPSSEALCLCVWAGHPGTFRHNSVIKEPGEMSAEAHRLSHAAFCEEK